MIMCVICIKNMIAFIIAIKSNILACSIICTQNYLNYFETQMFAMGYVLFNKLQISKYCKFK